MVDALDSKSGVSNGVRVRVSSPVNFLYNNSLYIEGLFFYVDEKGTQKGGNQWADWTHWAHWAVCGALFGSLLLKLWYSMALPQDISLPFAFLLVFALVSL